MKIEKILMCEQRDPPLGSGQSKWYVFIRAKHFERGFSIWIGAWKGRGNFEWKASRS